MSTFLFEDRRAFGKIDLLLPEGGTDLEIPVDLVDRPDVLEALMKIARQGGARVFNRLSDSEVLAVNLTDGTVAARELDL